jgi:hypothetical protein
MNMFRVRRSHLVILAAVAIAIAVFGIFGPFLMDAVYFYSGVAAVDRFGPVSGVPTIDPNAGTLSFPLGARAAFEVLAGKLPLWNFYEGLGTPLLGEMQSAALFPPTWLLSLKHGQLIEHALLQFIGGVGAFLFFRKFGLGVTAAVTGALLYELNGVFAWLRNAIFNPVAFLPWLLLSMEWIRANAIGQLTYRERLPAIGVGGVAGALALYAGFPEQVYLYAFLVAIWTGFRVRALAAQELRRAIPDIFAMAIISAVISAPVLVTFADFLMDSDWGRHKEGFYGAYFGPTMLLQYLAPYVYGSIFGTSNPAVMGMWSGIGGYVGFLPVAAAIGALVFTDRRGAKAVLVLWVVVCLCVTHGMPGVYQAFMALPLMKTAAVSRYLNPSWIFCIIFLVALFIDRLAEAAPAAARRAVVCAVLAGLAVVAAVGVAALPLISELWLDNAARRYVAAALAAVAVLSGGMIALGWSLRGEVLAKCVSALLVAEALAWFCFPMLSHLRAARVDEKSISFLQAHIGLQRVVETQGQGIGPNFGSYFGIPTLSYGDLPVPARTVAYLQKHIDRHAGTEFVWNGNLPPAELAARDEMFRERLPLYGAIGVKYLLAPADYNAIAAFQGLSDVEKGPHGLSAGQRLEISAVRGPAAEDAIAGLTVLVGTYGDTATGSLGVRLCARGLCAEGDADIAHGRDGQPLAISLDNVLDIGPGEAFTVSFRKIGGENLIAVWLLNPSAGGEQVPVRAWLPKLGFIPRKDLLPVHQGPAMSIFEIPGVRPYFSAGGCDVTPLSRNRVEVNCPTPNTLLRLELYMRGWRARVNGRNVVLGQEDDTFQTVAVAAGKSVVEFSYRPPGLNLALAAAILGIAAVLAIFAGAVASRVRAA